MNCIKKNGIAQLLETGTVKSKAVPVLSHRCVRYPAVFRIRNCLLISSLVLDAL